MPSFSKNDVVLVRYPFSDIAAAKVRPAVVVSAPHTSDDYFLVPLTSRVTNLREGEHILTDWQSAGLNMTSAVKRGVYTVHGSLIVKLVGRLSVRDAQQVEQSLRLWFGLA